MPQNYKNVTRNFTEADIQSAVLLVKSGVESLKKVAHTTGIPPSTSSRWVNIKTLRTLDLNVKLQCLQRLKNCWLMPLNLWEI